MRQLELPKAQGDARVGRGVELKREMQEGCLRISEEIQLGWLGDRFGIGVLPDGQDIVGGFTSHPSTMRLSKDRAPGHLRLHSKAIFCGAPKAKADPPAARKDDKSGGRMTRVGRVRTGNGKSQFGVSPLRSSQ